MSPRKQSTVDLRRRPLSESTNDIEDSSGSLLATPPSSNLWVGNLSLDTTESELSALFAKYGALDRVTAYPSRNYAFVYFKRIDDARAAKETLQGALVRGNQIKIQYAKPAKSSKHLWIGRLSPAVTRKEIDEAFSKFGKIAELKQLKDRNSAFVDYYKVEDAADAMKNMNGKSLRGEKISVDYVRSLPSRRDLSNYHDPYTSVDQFKNFPESSQSGHKRPLLNVGRSGPPTNVLLIQFPPSFVIDEQQLHNALILFGEIENIKTIPGMNDSFVEFRSPKEACSAKEGLEGRLFNDPRIQIMFASSELNPFSDDSQFFPDTKGPSADMYYNEPSFGSGEAYAPSHLLGSSNFSDGYPMGWRPSPSGAGLLPPPSMLPSARPLHGAWDDFDGRDPKRSRIDGVLNDDTPFHSRMGSHDRYMLPQPERDSLSQIFHSPIRMRGSSASLPSRGEVNTLHSDHCWRGLIAKGGTPVCHARCLPIGKGLESPIPEVVNCSARTGLDMLAKHCAEANGFDIVFFLPDSEEDFASYTEFLRYLGGKKRAGVAKFDDGTTLFLVPPSDFLTRVLNVSGPERLYGVVLRIPPIIPPSPPQYVDRHHSQIGYNSEPQGENLTRLEYRRGPREDLSTQASGGKLLVPHDEESCVIPTSLGYNGNIKVAPQLGLSLTPELIATLASLAPSGAKTSVSSSVQLPLNASTRPPAIPDRQLAHFSSQQTAQVNTQAASHHPQFSNYGNLGNSSEYPIQLIPGSLQQSQGSTIAAQHANSTYSLQQGMPLDNANQQFHPEASYISNNSYDVTQSADMNARHHNSSVQQSLSFSSSTHVQSVPAQVGKELPFQLQQLQPTLTNSSQSITTAEADKNQRYQSTLQFAANLLKQIQQKQLQGTQQ